MSGNWWETDERLIQRIVKEFEFIVSSLKCECKALSLKNKIEILKEFDKSARLTKVELAKKLDISVSTFKIFVCDKKNNNKKKDRRQGNCL